MAAPTAMLTETPATASNCGATTGTTCQNRIRNLSQAFGSRGDDVRQGIGLRQQIARIPVTMREDDQRDRERSGDIPQHRQQRQHRGGNAKECSADHGGHRVINRDAAARPRSKPASRPGPAHSSKSRGPHQAQRQRSPLAQQGAHRLPQGERSSKVAVRRAIAGRQIEPKDVVLLPPAWRNAFTLAEFK
jgi:hypothetical protein